jgi:uncharacterized protein (TIGR03086 family)
MTRPRATASLLGGIGLLERAINYTLGSLHLVTPAAMSRPTPCRDWDLGALLRHVDDSLTALYEAIDLGRVDLVPPEGDLDGDPVAAVRDRARRLLGAWAAGGSPDAVSIAGRPLTPTIVTSTGAVEVAVHGWDVARACGRDRPIPPSLAFELLELSPLLVTEADRPGLFAPPVDVSPLASPGDRLLAFLGRDPRGPDP